jgi:hypothetical protein
VVDQLLEVAVLPVDLRAHLAGGGPHVAALFPGLEWFTREKSYFKKYLEIPRALGF